MKFRSNCTGMGLMDYYLLEWHCQGVVSVFLMPEGKVTFQVGTWLFQSKVYTPTLSSLQAIMASGA